MKVIRNLFLCVLLSNSPLLFPEVTHVGYVQISLTKLSPGAYSPADLSSVLTLSKGERDLVASSCNQFSSIDYEFEIPKEVQAAYKAEKFNLDIQKLNCFEAKNFLGHTKLTPRKSGRFPASGSQKRILPHAYLILKAR